MSKQPRTSLSTTTRAPLRVNLPWYNNNPFVILPSTERVRKFTGCYFCLEILWLQFSSDLSFNIKRKFSTVTKLASLRPLAKPVITYTTNLHVSKCTIPTCMELRLLQLGLDSSVEERVQELRLFL